MIVQVVFQIMVLNTDVRSHTIAPDAVHFFNDLTNVLHAVFKFRIVVVANEHANVDAAHGTVDTDRVEEPFVIFGFFRHAFSRETIDEVHGHANSVNHLVFG